MKNKVKFFITFLLIIGIVIFLIKRIENPILPEYYNSDDTIITGYNMSNEGYEASLNYSNINGYIVIKKDSIK